MLMDTFGRPLNYLRMAITDRCNLRCHYCMPRNGLNWIPRKELLTADEIIRLAEIFSSLGVTKIRFTGGEPTLRPDFNAMVMDLHQRRLFHSMHLTTNATQDLALFEIGESPLWSSVNVSLDSLDAANFARITGRNEWTGVMRNITNFLGSNTLVRINMVVMKDKNDHEILDFVQWAMDEKLDVRFIEEMPFNGHQKQEPPYWTADRILDWIKTKYALTSTMEVLGETASYYHTSGMQGRIGVIAAYSRSFCGSCNRLRITPQGVLRTCLYSEGELNLRDAMRNGFSDNQLGDAIKIAVMTKAKNGFEAEKNRLSNATESMALIGG